MVLISVDTVHLDGSFFSKLKAGSENENTLSAFPN